MLKPLNKYRLVFILIYFLCLICSQCVVYASPNASCPFKSFISITQQVVWHTSTKQPEKRKLTGQGGAGQAKESDTYVQGGPLIRAVTVATVQTDSNTTSLYSLTDTND